jgi:hypothetical protein
MEDAGDRFIPRLAKERGEDMQEFAGRFRVPQDKQEGQQEPGGHIE